MCPRPRLVSARVLVSAQPGIRLWLAAYRTPFTARLFAPRCRAQVLVVANPANTNALILKENAPSIPAGEWGGV